MLFVEVVAVHMSGMGMSDLLRVITGLFQKTKRELNQGAGLRDKLMPLD